MAKQAETTLIDPRRIAQDFFQALINAKQEALSEAAANTSAGEHAMRIDRADELLKMGVELPRFDPVTLGVGGSARPIWMFFGGEKALSMSPVRKRTASEDWTEQRVPTPRRDLIVVRVGSARVSVTPSKKKLSGALIQGIARATRKPGIQRSMIFRSPSGGQVYAYSIHPRDVTKIIREDKKGRKTTGRFVNGKFKALPAKSA